MKSLSLPYWPVGLPNCVACRYCWTFGRDERPEESSSGRLLPHSRKTRRQISYPPLLSGIPERALACPSDLRITGTEPGTPPGVLQPVSGTARGIRDQPPEGTVQGRPVQLSDKAPGTVSVAG